MNGRHWFSGLALACAVCAHSNAALINVDDPKFGSKALVRDTDTGLDWLNITKTYPYSYSGPSGMLDQLKPGGDYEDFHYASVAEVLTLIGHAGIPISPYPYEPVERNDPASYAKVKSFADLIGAYRFDDGSFLIHGVTSDFDLRDDIAYQYNAEIGGYPMSGETFAALAKDQRAMDSFPGWGSWLIRDVAAPIPEASTTAMLLTGFALVGLYTRRRAPL